MRLFCHCFVAREHDVTLTEVLAEHWENLIYNSVFCVNGVAVANSWLPLWIMYQWTETASGCFHRVFCLQMGTNKCASQAGMNAYGTRRHLYDPKVQIQPPMDNTTISLQMGTNKGASQVVHLRLSLGYRGSGRVVLLGMVQFTFTGFSWNTWSSGRVIFL